MLEGLEYLFYFARTTIVEVGVTLGGLVVLYLCLNSRKVSVGDRTVLDRNGADAYAYREVAAQIRSATGRAAVAGMFALFGMLSMFSEPSSPPTPRSIMGLLLLLATLAVLGHMQVRDRQDRALNITELLEMRRAREASGAGIITIDQHSVILQFNAAAERIFGYSAAEVLDTSMLLLIPEQYREGHTRGMARAFASTEPSPRMGTVINLPGLRKDGTEVPLHIQLNETFGVSGKMFTAYFTAEREGHSERPRGLEELRHDQQLARTEENIALTAETKALTAETKALTAESKRAAEIASDAANHANDKIAATNRQVSAANDVAQQALQSLENYIRQVEEERRAAEAGREHRAAQLDRAEAREDRRDQALLDAADKLEQQEVGQDDRRDERERNRP